MPRGAGESVQGGGLVHRVDPGDRTELDEDIPQVPLDRRFFQGQPGSDLAVAECCPDKAEYPPLAGGEGHGPRAKSLAGVPEALPRDPEHHAVGVQVHGADGEHKLLPVDALEQVALMPASSRLKTAGRTELNTE
jgi:hypothetical protein